MHRDPPVRARAAIGALALAAAAALAPAPAAAQTRRDPPAKPAAARAPSASTAAPLAAVPGAAAAVPLPPPPSGTALQPRRAGWLAVAAGPWAGFGAGSGPAFLVDYGYSRTPPGWKQLQLEVHLAAMLSRPTGEEKLTTTIVPPYGTPVQVSSGVEEMSAWVVEVVPTARVRLPVGPKFALFADGGLGLAQTVERYDRQEMYAGHTETTKNVTGLVLRLGAGMSFELSERTRLLFVPIALSLQLGPDFSAFTPTLGLAYRL